MAISSSKHKVVNGLNLLFAATLISAGLLGCDRADQKTSLVDGADSQATFLVDKASGDGELINPDVRSSWQAPISSSFSLMACLKDRMNGESLRGHAFVIEKGEDGHQLNPVGPSDINGCVKWVEEIPFNFYAKRSARIPITRYIVGHGIYKGRAEVKLALNPWALGSHSRDKGDAVVFLRDQILPKAQMARYEEVHAALSGELNGSADLWVPDVEINSLRRRAYDDGQVIDLTFQMKPKVRSMNMNGELDYSDLKSGEFDVIAHLVATETGPSQTEKVILNNSELQGSGKLMDGSLVVTIRTSLERRVAFGNLELALKLIPRRVGSLNGLNPFEGIFELGAVHELNRGPKGILNEACRKAEKSCSVAAELKSATNFEDLKKTGWGLKNDPYIFSNLKLRFVRVQPGETATQRTVNYTASTCIKDRFTGQDMADVKFQVEYLDANGSPITSQNRTPSTNEEGCLSWDSTIFHKYYQPEQLFWQTVRISLPNGFTKTLRFALNPWDDKFTFGWDEREFSADFIRKLQERKKIKSRFFLGTFGYHALRFLYNIDRFMELEVKKTVLLDLSPQVLRYSGIINARQETEHLRDGIYLMKVAIQKDYLDPANSGRGVKNKRDAVSSTYIEELHGDIMRKEYITTQTHLVRVVDGYIIQPVELTMRDLRLMRVRGNFLIQLETVDERLLQAHQVLRDQLKKDLQSLEEKRATMTNMSADDREAFLQKSALDRKAKLESAFYLLKNQLSSDKPTLDNMDLGENVTQTLKSALDTNDFTEIKFPPNEGFDLNDFVEKDSGLEARTFVGPVIFLSNGFSDSVRATDNLDEAHCDEPDAPELKNKGLAQNANTGSVPASLNKVRTETENPFKWEEMKLFSKADEQASVSRQNNAYRFSKYYGSLKHLCNKSVDDIIKREKELNKFYKENMPVLSSIYNFVNLYKLDFVSFGAEKLSKLDMTCSGPVADCMRDTNEQTLTPKALLTYINQDFKVRQMVHGPRANDKLAYVDAKGFQEKDLQSLIFAKPGTTTTNFAYCSLLAGRSADRVLTISQDERYSGWFNRTWGKMWHDPSEISRVIFRDCMLESRNQDSPLIIEDKLRVKETGKYTFMGGLQVNLNVGDSFSVGRSKSWSYSVKPTDALEVGLPLAGTAIGAMIGGPPGAAIGAGVGVATEKAAEILKPLSISMGEGMSSSDGTSVSQSTYLVAQIARFNLQLTQYEKCRVLRFDPDFATRVATSTLGLDPKFAELLSMGVFACSGEPENEPRNVEESYFYFTQHFTEGDMLDQADLYNHPWLLGLRGVREFAAFVKLTQAQEVMNVSSFAKGVVNPEKRALGWPLSHMEKAYRRVLPTYPGLYTVIDGREMPPSYPLSERLTKTDEDINAEVRCQMRADGTCAEKGKQRPLQ